MCCCRVGRCLLICYCAAVLPLRRLVLSLCSRYDNLTVTVQHDTRGGGHFCTLAARGSPYMTFEFAAATPRIKSNGDVLEVLCVRAREG